MIERIYLITVNALSGPWGLCGVQDVGRLDSLSRIRMLHVACCMLHVACCMLHYQCALTIEKIKIKKRVKKGNMLIGVRGRERRVGGEDPNDSFNRIFCKLIEESVDCRVESRMNLL